MKKLGVVLLAVLAGILSGPMADAAQDRAPIIEKPTTSMTPEAVIALRNFSVGFIRPAKDMIYDARVSQITGDNQTTGNKRLLGGRDQIYLELPDPEAVAPGDKFTIFRQVKKVFHPVDGKYLGDLTATLGVVKVIRVTGTKATVKIERSFDAIFPGDGAVRQKPPSTPPLPLFPPLPPDGTGVIVELPPGQTLIAQGHVVYIDWGRNDGLKIGDKLEVIRQQGEIPVQVIGELQVVALEDLTATARVTKSTAPLLLGDRFTAKATLHGEPATEAAAPQDRKEAMFEEMAAAPKSAEVVQEAHAAPGMRDIEAELARLTKLVTFDPGSAPATEASLPILNKIKALLMEVPDRRMVVQGHTDAQKIGPSLLGLFSSNQELSRARAKTVAEFLTQDGGISAGNITIVGYSDTKPVATNGTEEGRKQNRRIEITLVPKDEPAAPAPAPPASTSMTPAPAPAPPASAPMTPVPAPGETMPPAIEPAAPPMEPAPDAPPAPTP